MSLALASLATAGLGALQSLYTSNQNKKAVQSTNQMNLQIARETNQANADLYQQQFRDQLYMQKMQNDYNSASAQVQRLREAGLNPALSFGDSSNVAPLSVPSAAPAQTGAPMQPYIQNVSDTPVYQALGALSTLTGSSKDFEEAKGINIDNQYKHELIQQELQQAKVGIDEALERIKSSRMDRKQKAAATRKLIAESVNLDLLNEVTKSQQGELSRSAELQNLLTEAQTQALHSQKQLQSEQILSSQLQRVLALRADTRAAQEISSVIASNYANAYMMSMQGNLTSKEVDNFAWRTLAQIWSIASVKQELEERKWNFEKYKSVLFPLVRDQMRLGVYHSALDVTHYNQNRFLGTFGNSLNTFGGYMIGKAKSLTPTSMSLNGF